MKIIAPIAASAVGAGVTGAAAGLLALTTAQAHLPALMARAMRPIPDLQHKRVLLCTGEADPRTRGTARDEAQQWRRAIEAEHEISVVLVDLRTGPRPTARQRARAQQLAESVPSDRRREFAIDDPAGRTVIRTRGSRGPAAGPR